MRSYLSKDQKPFNQPGIKGCSGLPAQNQAIDIWDQLPALRVQGSRLIVIINQGRVQLCKHLRSPGHLAFVAHTLPRGLAVFIQKASWKDSPDQKTVLKSIQSGLFFGFDQRHLAGVACQFCISQAGNRIASPLTSYLHCPFPVGDAA